MIAKFNPSSTFFWPKRLSSQFWKSRRKLKLTRLESIKTNIRLVKRMRETTGIKRSKKRLPGSNKRTRRWGTRWWSASSKRAPSSSCSAWTSQSSTCKACSWTLWHTSKSITIGETTLKIKSELIVKIGCTGKLMMNSQRKLNLHNSRTRSQRAKLIQSVLLRSLARSRLNSRFRRKSRFDKLKVQRNGLSISS